MRLFSHHPMNVWAVAGLRSYPEVNRYRIDPEGPIAIPMSVVANQLGRHTSIEFIHFAAGKSDEYEIPEFEPTDHLYQILGSCILDGQHINPGDVCSIITPKLTPISEPHAPCVVARLHFSNLHDRILAAEQPSMPVGYAGETHAVHDLSYRNQILVEDFVAPEICDAIIASLVTAGDGENHYGHVLTDAANNVTTYDASVRQTEIMRGAEPKDRKIIRQTLRKIILERVEAFYGVIMDFWNRPVLLKYAPGGFFVPHVDGETPTSEGWMRIYDRDYTLVTFLNDDYEGGRLVFPDLDFTVTPKKGRICAFPGSHIFRHGAETTSKGTRYQLVSWLTAEGTLRTNIPPNPAVIYRQV